MALYKASEFYKKIGMSGNAFAVYKARGKVIVVDGYIDDKNPINQLFIANFSINKDRREIKDIKNPVIKKEKEPEKPKNSTNIYKELKEKTQKKLEELSDKVPKQQDYSSYSTDLTALEKARALKYKEEIEILKIKRAKMEGQLIPFDAAEQIFIWAFEQFKKTLEQNAESIAQIYIKILEGTQDQMNDIRNRMLDSINENFNQGIEYIKIGLENVVNEFMEERGKGERK